MTVGTCVELCGLKDARHTEKNGMRGFVQPSRKKQLSSARIAVALSDGSSVLVKEKNVVPVFCLGLPREALSAAFMDTPAELIPLPLDDHLRILVNPRVLDMAWDRIGTELCKRFPKCVLPRLLRIYVADYSQDDPEAKILFDLCCAKPYICEEMPWFVDLSEEELRTHR